MSNELTLAYLAHEVISHDYASQLAELSQGQIGLVDSVIHLAPSVDAGFVEWTRLYGDAFSGVFAYEVIPAVAGAIATYMARNGYPPQPADVTRWTVERMEVLEDDLEPLAAGAECAGAFRMVAKIATEKDGTDVDYEVVPWRDGRANIWSIESLCRDVDGTTCWHVEGDITNRQVAEVLGRQMGWTFAYDAEASAA